MTVVKGGAIITRDGFRLNIGIVLINDNNQVFWAKRCGYDAWQFPQGGLIVNETVHEAMFRELKEEIGLESDDVDVLGVTRRWHYYRLPKAYIRRASKPLVIGQKQKWFLLRLKSAEDRIVLDGDEKPEFDHWEWVDYWYPVDEVIYFKRQVYQSALKDLEQFVPKLQAE